MGTNQCIVLWGILSLRCIFSWGTLSSRACRLLEHIVFQGILSPGVNSRPIVSGRVVSGAGCLGDGLALGRVASGTGCLWDGLPPGHVVSGVVCHCGILSPRVHCLGDGSSRGRLSWDTYSLGTVSHHPPNPTQERWITSFSFWFCYCLSCCVVMVQCCQPTLAQTSK